MTEGNTMNQPQPRENDASPEEIEAHEREVEQSIAEHEISIDSEEGDRVLSPVIIRDLVVSEDGPGFILTGKVDEEALAASDYWLTEEGSRAIAEPDDSPREHEVEDPEIEAAHAELSVGVDDEDLGPDMVSPDEDEDRPEEPWPPADVDESMFPKPLPAPPLQILVAASYGFSKAVIIQSVLGEWIQRHSARQIVVATSGAPEGGEALAAAFAQQMGAQLVSIRDEQIQPGMFTHAFAFLTGESRGARATVDAAAAAGVAITRVEILDEPARGPWTSR